MPRGWRPPVSKMVRNNGLEVDPLTCCPCERFFPRFGEHMTAVSNALGYSKFSFVVETMGVPVAGVESRGRGWPARIE